MAERGPARARAALFVASLAVAILAAPGLVRAGSGGKLLATDGATQLEGSGGGGLVPWAMITGNETEDGVGASAFATGIFVDDYQLSSFGAAVGLFDRIELSFAHQRFEIQSLDQRIDQNVYGVKLRAFGDLVYGKLPVVSAGMQVKHNLDFELPEALGARDDWGIDAYLSVSRVFLDAVAGRNLLVNANLRMTRANETGLLGFGGDKDDDYRPVFEGSAALFLTRRIALGYEYRQKTSGLDAAGEDDWQDVFVAFVPSHHVKIVASYVRLGNIAGSDRQDGAYLSLQGSF
jgi:hypothetical protein